MKLLSFLYCLGLFIAAVALGLIAAFFHLLAWPFYVAAIGAAKGIHHANRNSQSAPRDGAAHVCDVPPRVPPVSR